MQALSVPNEYFQPTGSKGLSLTNGHALLSATSLRPSAASSLGTVGDPERLCQPQLIISRDGKYKLALPHVDKLAVMPPARSHKSVLSGEKLTEYRQQLQAKMTTCVQAQYERENTTNVAAIGITQSSVFQTYI